MPIKKIDVTVLQECISPHLKFMHTRISQAKILQRSLEKYFLWTNCTYIKSFKHKKEMISQCLTEQTRIRISMQVAFANVISVWHSCLFGGPLDIFSARQHNMWRLRSMHLCCFMFCPFSLFNMFLSLHACLNLNMSHVTVCVCHTEIKGYLLTYLLT